jgi:energy-coupling factor transporter ATP-binding protein EcfA2
VQRLIGYGLRLSSQLAVPGGVPDDRDGPSDLSILLDPPQSSVDAPVYARTDDGLCFVCPGVASYRIAVESIRVTPDPDARPDMITGMLVATAIPAWLWLRGRFVLHAGAVGLPGGGAIAIAGASGSGKSTILAQLVAAGAALIGDDTIAFSRDTGTQASGLAGGWFAPNQDASGRQFVPMVADQSCTAAPIGAILLLGPYDAADGGLTRLDPVAAVTGLLTHRHRPRVPALLGRTVDILRDATLLAGAIPLYSWTRRAGGAMLTPAERAMLERIGMGKEIE